MTWPSRLTPETIARYEGSGAWTGETLHQAAWAKAERVPDAVAIHLEDGPPVTFAAIAEEARALAGGMAALGLKPGDTVSFILPNWREAAAINIAASALGLVVNPIVPIYRDAECRHILRDARAKLVFVPGRLRGFDYRAMAERLKPDLPALRHVATVRPEEPRPDGYDALLSLGRGRAIAWPAVDPNSVKLILYTSGTTGPAKGVLHTHNTIAAGRRTAVGYWGIGPEDIMLMPSPVTHITGYSMGLELPFFSDAASALMARWDAAAAVDFIQQIRATMMLSATPFLEELAREAERRGIALPSLRLFACGGAAVPPDAIRRGHRTFARCRCIRIYGSSEAPGITRGWMGPGEEELAATTDGRVVGWEVAILGPDGMLTTDSLDGEIAVRGPALTIGYTDAGQTGESFTADGFFLTGDLGRLTPDGALTVTGRKKDLIIRGGENLSPKEIEDVLHRHPAIREAAVVAMPHARLGEGICAFVIPAPGAAPPELGEIAAFVRQAGLAGQKCPERIEIVADFPRTASGKVRKDVLRETVRRIIPS